MPGPDDALLRFCQPERILATTRLPGLAALDDDVLARLYGIDRPALARTRARWRREAEAAVEAALRTDRRLVRGLRALPLGRGDRVLALGDSITADRQSWAELLTLALDAVRARDRIAVVNAGLSGDTTTGAIARSRAFAGDHVLVLLGTNDARRHGRERGVMLVSHRETARNVVALRRLLRAASRTLAWITPPPCRPERVGRDALFRAADLDWRLDDLAGKARIVRRLPDPVIDLWPAFGSPAGGDLLLADGLHPSLAGQLAILAAVVAGWPKRASSQAVAKLTSSAAGKRKAVASPTGPRVPMPADSAQAAIASSGGEPSGSTSP
jgi:acyl-CoA thioesterase-1